MSSGYSQRSLGISRINFKPKQCTQKTCDTNVIRLKYSKNGLTFFVVSQLNRRSKRV